MKNLDFGNSIVCPVCGEYKFKYPFDICKNCFWEYDVFQFDSPDESGLANGLSLNDYKNWWACLERVVSKFLADYGVRLKKKRMWKYEKLICPKKHLFEINRELKNYDFEFEQVSNGFVIYTNPSKVPNIELIKGENFNEN